MGLSFHYSGKFNPCSSLKEMINEVKDICEIYHWKYHVFETEFPASGFTRKYSDKIYGICFTPPECETVHLEFLSNGRMSSFTNLEFFGNSERKDYQKYLYMISVKTQFAGVKVHALVISILKHLNKKYFLGFHLEDEGYYWETGDLELLKKRFREYEALLDSFSLGLDTIPVQNGENLEEYLLRLANYIRAKNKGKE
jgi:hypothetical protein